MEQRSPIPFVIVADMRTGSTLLASSLDRHPQIRCLGELLHPDDFDDNQLPSSDRHRLQGAELVRCALTAGRERAVGFRAMIFLPPGGKPHWQEAWNTLAATRHLRVIYLRRRNRLAQYASVAIADRTGRYHPQADDPVLVPKRRPKLVVNRAAFQRWIRERDHLFARRREQLDGKPSLDVWYESLADQWAPTLNRVHRFLGVPPRTIEQTKQKQETRPLDQIIVNYDDVTEIRG